MDVRTRIGNEARARGFTVAEIARQLGWYRSNLSAMDAGRRPISLRRLARLATILSCSPADLIEVGPAFASPVFRARRIQLRLAERETRASSREDKGWVHTVQLAWKRHYQSDKRSR